MREKRGKMKLRTMKESQMDLKLNEAFVLDAPHIDHIGETVEEFLSIFKTERKLALKVKLAMEDLLSIVLKNSNSPRNCRLLFHKRLSSGSIQIEYEGTLFNPLEVENDEFTEILLKNLGIPCEWGFRNNVNYLTIHVQRKRSSNTLPLLVAIAAAVVLGAASSYCPEGIKTTVSAWILIPFRHAFLGLLKSLAGILLFFNVVSGVCGDTDTQPLDKQSRLQMIVRFPLVLTILTVFSYLIMLLFSNINFSVSSIGGQAQTDQIITLLWGMIPDNVLSPFIDGNFIHILIFALLFGITLSEFREKYPALISSVNGINSIIMTVTTSICRLIPLFVFCSLLNQIMTPDAFKTLRDVWKPVVMYPAVSVILILLVFTAMGLKFRCKSWRALRVMFPAWLISVTTGSRMASYSTNLEILEKHLGVSKRFSRIGLSVSGKLYPMGVSLYLAVMVVFFAEKYQFAVSFGWLAVALLLTVLLTFAGPPIPGELLVIFGMIAGQLGLPDECLTILAAVDVILDGIATGTSCILRNAELVFAAASCNELDMEMLRRL